VTRAGTRLFMGAVLGLGLRKIYRLLASGELTLDLARGRRLRPLGPLMWSIQAPQEIAFDVIGGLVPHLLETFQLSPTDTGSELRWQGELGTNLWALGQWWGGRVATAWTHAVQTSLREISTEAERRVLASAQRAARDNA
jgi:hypothetical protein